MVLAVWDWAFGVPKPLTLVEPVTPTGVGRFGGVGRVTNPWERIYNQGRGSVWGLQVPPGQDLAPYHTRWRFPSIFHGYTRGT